MINPLKTIDFAITHISHRPSPSILRTCLQRVKILLDVVGQETQCNYKSFVMGVSVMPCGAECWFLTNTSIL